MTYDNHYRKNIENRNFLSVKVKREFLPSYTLSPEIVAFAGRHWEESNFSDVPCAMCNYIRPS